VKIEFLEHEGCFEVCLEAETKSEAALLVRFGMNRTDEIRSSYTNVSQTGEFSNSIVFGKSKRANSDVPKRK
jgi:hypothetical protein